jgi:hypothetical protein
VVPIVTAGDQAQGARWGIGTVTCCQSDIGREEAEIVEAAKEKLDARFVDAGLLHLI